MRNTNSTNVTRTAIKKSTQSLSGCGDGELAMLDTTGTYQKVCHGRNFGRCSPQNQDFEAMMVIEVNMKGGDDQFQIFVLDGVQVLGDVPFVMVEYEVHGSDRLSLPSCPLSLDKVVTNKIPYCFRPVCVPLFSNETVKGMDKPRFHRNPETRQTHTELLLPVSMNDQGVPSAASRFFAKGT